MCQMEVNNNIRNNHRRHRRRHITAIAIIVKVVLVSEVRQTTDARGRMN